MSEAAKKVLAALLELPPDERVGVSQAGIESVPVDDEDDDRYDAEYEAELNRRLAAIRSGESPGIPAEVVMQRLKEKYG